MPQTLIVIPCYNEAARLRFEPFGEALQADGQLSFLFVDDGSVDETAGLLAAWQQRAPERLAVLPLERNEGKAEAVRRGVLHTLDHGGYGYCGYWDADLATPLDHVGEFRALLEQTQASMALGARVQLLGRDIRRTLPRHYLGRVFASVVSLTLRLPVYDTQCGAKLFRCDNSLRAVFGQPFSSRWIFDVEIMARYRNLLGDGFAIEVPLQSWRDVSGSKLKARDFVTSGFDFLRILRQVYLR